MTPRRRLCRALTVLSGALAAIALVGCSNGVHVAGPGQPHESVLSEAPTPTAHPSKTPSDAQPQGAASKSATDNPPATSSAPNSGPGTNGGQQNGSGGSTGSKQSDGPSSGDNPTSSAAQPSSETSAPGNGSGTTTTTSNGRTCKLADLSVGARVPAGGGAAGSQYILITFTNTSGTSCWMYGYAGVSFVGDQNGTQLGKPAARVKSVPASPVELADGDTQTELLQIADAGVWDASECAPTTSDGFRIYPPSSFTAAYVKFATNACQSTTVRQLHVYPVGTKS